MFTGCISSRESTPEETSEPPGGRVGQNSTVTTNQNSDLKITQHELIDPGDRAAIIQGRIQNNGEREIPRVVITGEFYDDQGTILEQSVNVVLYISPGDTHVFRVWYIGERNNDVVDYDLTFEARGRPAGSNNEGQIEVITHEVADYDGQHWGVSGTIENNANKEYAAVQIYAKFYADNRLVEYRGQDIVKDFGPGERYIFDIYYKGRMSREDIEEYELKITHLDRG